MSTLGHPVRKKSWIMQLTALCTVLGILLALSLKTQRQAVKEGVPLHMPDVRAALRITKEQNIKLQKDLQEYKDRVEKMAKEQAAGLSGAKRLEQILIENKMLAGTIAASGEGIVVSITDSPKLNPLEKNPENIESLMVHDYDIRGVINELFAAGAEAISVNDQRIIATSSVRCVGPVILVNSVKLAPPYKIKAIGKADALESTIKMQGGAADVLIAYEMLKVQRYPDIIVPAYTGSTRFHVAMPVGQISQGVE